MMNSSMAIDRIDRDNIGHDRGLRGVVDGAMMLKKGDRTLGLL